VIQLVDVAAVITLEAMLAAPEERAVWGRSARRRLLARRAEER
jgi:hypothetical protein